MILPMSEEAGTMLESMADDAEPSRRAVLKWGASAAFAAVPTAVIVTFADSQVRSERWSFMRQAFWDAYEKDGLLQNPLTVQKQAEQKFEVHRHRRLWAFGGVTATLTTLAARALLFR
jgi:hypothetical protein